MGYKTFILSFLLSMNLFASDFLVGFVHNKNLSQIKLKTSLFIFSDGKYVLNSSSGDIGLCRDYGSAGKFKGKLSQKKMEEVTKLLNNVEKECKASKSCQNGLNDNTGEKFVIFDYREKDKNYTFADSNSKMIDFFDLEYKSFKTSPLQSLKLQLKEKSIELSYEGTEEYKTMLGVNNIVVLEKGGAFVSLKEYMKSDHDHPSVAKFNKKKKKYSFSPKLDWTKLKEKGKFLIYTNKTDAHHLDPKMKIYTPCTEI